MNTETLDRLEALLAKSADGPWHVVLYGDGDSLVVHDAREEYRVCFMATPGSDEGSMEQIEAHAKLIAEMRSALPALLSIARRAADVEGMASIITRCAHEPRFGGRRSLDKSCGEVYEITDRDCIPADGFPVVETIPLPNFSGERAAQERAEELSLSYTATAVSRYVMGETT